MWIQKSNHEWPYDVCKGRTTPLVLPETYNLPFFSFLTLQRKGLIICYLILEAQFKNFQEGNIY